MPRSESGLGSEAFDAPRAKPTTLSVVILRSGKGNTVRFPARLALTASGLVLATVISWHSFSLLLAGRPAEHFSIESFEGARRIVPPTPLSAELRARISQVFSAETPRTGSSGSGFLLVDGVPFFQYWQDSTLVYRFHPMGYGGFISSMATNPEIGHYIEKLVDTSVKKANGGYLWHYPGNYNVNRMIGKELPSAISQAQILGGLVDANVDNENRFRDVAVHAFLGITFDYYDGGVNLENRALLELPLFRSAPEIVLNGWLHALIHVHSYAEWAEDEQAESLIDENLAFLTASIDNFHDENTGLSLYSDLSPYKITVRHGSETAPKLFAYYDSNIIPLDDIVIHLKDIGYPGTSPYDNQIISNSVGRVQAWVNCSQIYDTYIVGDAPFGLSLSAGEYDPKRATPRAGGEEIKLESVNKQKWNVVDLSSARDQLFCGFPTNFAKNGNENYYHVYHVVALAYILANFELTDEQARTLGNWMITWYDAIESFEPSEEMRFSSPAYVLKGLARHHRQIRETDWAKLFESARRRWRMALS